ncbi:CapA family protein [Marvinbryantia sp.]|uniref:CapA family protein n=1 Tax=Marvinbryantia sp. TaxID=2496532 RepID=UPI003A8F405F
MSKKREVIICSVGDLMLSDSPLFVGVGVGATFQSIKDEVFYNCEEHFSNANIVIGNFETVVYHPKHKNLAELQMSCPESTIDIVGKAGFSILNLANNHCLQHGTDAFFHTKKVCEEAGIGVIGIKNENPYIIDIDGVKFAFLSLFIHIELYQPDDIRYEDDNEKVLRKTELLHNEQPDTVIVLAVHWGDEFATFPSNAQIEIAHKFADTGVSILLGHHSHVFQGIEKYKDSLIVYGQGNFVSDMVPQICRQTGIVEIKVTKQEGPAIISYEMHPYYINDCMYPIPSDGGWFLDRQKKLQEALSGKYTDKDYWDVVNTQHRCCSNDFRKRFRKSFYKYKPNIFMRMMYEFFLRKMKKKLGG